MIARRLDGTQSFYRWYQLLTVGTGIIAGIQDGCVDTTSWADSSLSASWRHEARFEFSDSTRSAVVGTMAMLVLTARTKPRSRGSASPRCRGGGAGWGG